MSSASSRRSLTSSARTPSCWKGISGSTQSSGAASSKPAPSGGAAQNPPQPLREVRAWKASRSPVPPADGRLRRAERTTTAVSPPSAARSATLRSANASARARPALSSGSNGAVRRERLVEEPAGRRSGVRLPAPLDGVTGGSPAAPGIADVAGRLDATARQPEGSVLGEPTRRLACQTEHQRRWWQAGPQQRPRKRRVVTLRDRPRRPGRRLAPCPAGEAESDRFTVAGRQEQSSANAHAAVFLDDSQPRRVGPCAVRGRRSGGAPLGFRRRDDRLRLVRVQRRGIRAPADGTVPPCAPDRRQDPHRVKPERPQKPAPQDAMA